MINGLMGLVLIIRQSNCRLGIRDDQVIINGASTLLMPSEIFGRIRICSVIRKSGHTRKTSAPAETYTELLRSYARSRLVASRDLLSCNEDRNTQ